MKKRNFKEQIDYGDYPERMGYDIESELTGGRTSFSKHKAMPEGEKSYDQIAASKRFKDVVDTYLRYGGSRERVSSLPPDQVLGKLMSGVGQLIGSVNQIEQRNKKKLEDLAVKLIKAEFDIPDGAINFEPHLVPMQGLQKREGMRGNPEQFSDEEIEDAFDGEEENMLDFQDAFEKLDLEQQKRRFINSLVQGGAKKGHYMFELVADELDALSPDLLNKYGLMQSSMDYLYWLYPEQMKGMISGGGGQVAQVESDYNTNPPTIRAIATTFPLLIHELYKGVLTMLTSYGLPDDPRKRNIVVKTTDTLVGELWDSRLGPVFWEKFIEAHPDELYDEDKKLIRNLLIVEFSKLPAEKFLNIAQSFLAGGNIGKNYFNNLIAKIKKELEDAERETPSFDDDDDEDYYDGDEGGDDDDGGGDDLDALLKDLGIG
jgi:hypothetical protein